VLDTGGEVVRRIETEGMFPTNLAFAGTAIYVTEAQTGTIQVYDVEASGLPLHA
jgi:sugar lactone lactonase YvrE